jgi:hypothetical protein
MSAASSLPLGLKEFLLLRPQLMPNRPECLAAVFLAFLLTNSGEGSPRVTRHGAPVWGLDRVRVLIYPSPL